ncbi:LEM domain-containing protein 1 isoform X3 [Anarrhichthys ocellatus]|uniref:LEM domain-containing protein 1 isoform X3 n=1 Tax=Anarrhichthys ocellatus TaxID=433405 RepID=UPI0012ED9626|nr:lamina-associated polypeptide 2, isoforms beta/gamma-like isoform X3 [Anarrhichthys ocellatus]
MSLFSEDPAHLSKARLKLDLVAHNVALPPAKSKKEIYVELHLKHINQKNSADFSSDEEDQVRYVADEEEEEEEEEAEMADPSGLTDDDLMAALLKHGVKAGPIVASTRAVYEKKLRKLLQSDGHGCLNGVEQGVLYSDSEDEDENGEQEDEESGSEGAEEETHEQSDQAQQGSGQNGVFFYPQCFLPPSRLHAHSSRNRELSPKWNSGNVIQPLERSRPSCSKIPVGISRASSVDQRSGLGSGLDMPTPNKDNLKNQSLYYTPKASTYDWEIKEPMKDTFRDLLPNTNATPTGIYATRRRAIKGAAGRPVQYTYPDTPASPTTLERREVERRLVPVQIQILVFLIVVCLLYLIYVCVQDDSLSTFVALLDSLNQGTDSEEGLSLQAETRDAPALSGLE